MYEYFDEFEDLNIYTLFYMNFILNQLDYYGSLWDFQFMKNVNMSRDIFVCKVQLQILFLEIVF